jgi:hypothetical protein
MILHLAELTTSDRPSAHDGYVPILFRRQEQRVQPGAAKIKAAGLLPSLLL